MRQHTIYFVLCCLLTSSAHAFDWRDWFFTPDQQAQQAMQKQQHQQAATLFTDPQWQGAAHYRAGDYASALDKYSASNSAIAAYNRGNALAKLGDFQGAINAYEEALAKQPDFADAKYNKKIIENLPKQPQKKQPKEKQQQQQPSPENQQEKQQKPSKDNQQEKPEPSQPKNPPHKDKHSQPENKKTNPDPKPSQIKKPLSKQQQQSLDKNIDQALRTIPDDPGGLLKQKFRRDHLRYQQE